MAAISATGPLTVGDVLPLLEQALLDATEARLLADDPATDERLRQSVFRTEHRMRDLVSALRDIAPTCDGRCRRG